VDADPKRDQSSNKNRFVLDWLSGCAVLPVFVFSILVRES